MRRAGFAAGRRDRAPPSSGRRWALEQIGDAGSLLGRSGGQLCDEARLLEAVWRGEGDGRDAERADARIAVDADALAHHVTGPAQRDGVDELLGDRGHGLLALAFEVQV